MQRIMTASLKVGGFPIGVVTIVEEENKPPFIKDMTVDDNSPNLKLAMESIIEQQNARAEGGSFDAEASEGTEGVPCTCEEQEFEFHSDAIRHQIVINNYYGKQD